MTIKPLLRAAGWFLALSAAFGNGADAKPTPDNLLIVPGQHIGRVFIGDSKAAVHRRLGTPQRTFKLAGGVTSELWRSKTGTNENGSPYTLEVLYRSGSVTQIETTNPAFKTQSGLSKASFMGEWNDFYENDKDLRISKYRYPRKPTQMYQDWMKQGVAIEVEYTEATTHTVIVHRCGVPVIVDPGGRSII